MSNLNCLNYGYDLTFNLEIFLLAKLRNITYSNCEHYNTFYGSHVLMISNIDQSKELSSHIQTLKNNLTTCDIILSVNGRTVNAHRQILEARCEWIKYANIFFLKHYHIISLLFFNCIYAIILKKETASF